MWLNKYSLESIPNKLSKELGEDISLEDVKALIVDKKLDLWFLGHYIGRGKGESFHCVSNDKDSLYHILYEIGDKDKIIKVGGLEDIIYILKQGSYKNMTVTRHGIDVSGGLYIYGEILKKFVQNEKQENRGNQAIMKQLPVQTVEQFTEQQPVWEELNRNKGGIGLLGVEALKKYYNSSSSNLPNNTEELRKWIIANRDKLLHYKIDGDTMKGGLKINGTQYTKQQLKQSWSKLINEISGTKENI